MIYECNSLGRQVVTSCFGVQESRQWKDANNAIA